MNGLFRILGLLIAVGAIALAAPGLSAAEAEPGLDLRISTDKAEFAPGEPVGLTFTVTNNSGAACGIATSDSGTVRVTSLRRDGQELRPVLGHGYYPDGIQSDTAASFRTVAPGSAVEVEVTGLRLHDDDAADRVVVSSVSAMPSGGGLTALWPVGQAGRYELTATYAVPAVDGQPCTGSTNTATVTFTVGEETDGLPGWVLTGGVALAVLVLGGLAALLVRRRGRRTGAGALVVLTIIAAGVLAGPGPRARADLVIDPWGGHPFPPGGDPLPESNFENQVKGCLSTWRSVAAGSSPAAGPVGELLRRLEDPKTPRVRIVPTPGSSRAPRDTSTTAGPNATVIMWNPTSRRHYRDGVRRDPCAALYHEAVHADDRARKQLDFGQCGNRKIRINEVKATLAENVYRAALGLPSRRTYGGRPLPASLDECKPASELPKGADEEVLCEDVGTQPCARSSGDPHLTTFDGLVYDFQGVGEYVLVRGKGLEVQARQQPFGGYSRTVSVNNGVAFRVGESRVSLVVAKGDVAVRIDGAAVVLPRGERALPGGGVLERRESTIGLGPDTHTVRWPDGSAAEVDLIGTFSLRLNIKLARARVGGVAGLFGDFDGDPADDLTPDGGGEPLGTEPEFEPLYRTFGDSWRVRDDTSLFDYGDGESTETFTDRSFPDRRVTVAELDPAQRAEAERICRDAGVTGRLVLDECVLDVAVTGQPDFAVVSADTELVAPPAQPITAPTVAKDTLVVDRRGGTDRLTFTGKAGQAVFVDLAAATLPDQCGAVRLLGPSGARLPTGGCVDDGSGFLDRVELPTAGQYTVELAPKETTGRVLVRVYEAADPTGTITPDGPAETVRVTHPGSVGRLTFDGRAGQRVFVEVPGTSLSDDRCGVLQLLGPDGGQLNTGCVIDGDGHVDATTLKAGGRHTVLVDPDDRAVGETEVRLVAVHDQRGTIAVGGEPVRATVRQPGATSTFEFRGRAGQRLRVEASEGTLPDQCGVLSLTGPGGRSVGSACVLSGAGDIDEVTLRADGVYRVVFDPGDRATGSVSLRVVT